MEERELKAILFRLKEGKKQYDKVKMIRLKSKDVNLLLMLDHAPVIGELNGTMSIVCEEEEYEFEAIHGFFHLRNNEFHFLQQEGNEDRSA